MPVTVTFQKLYTINKGKKTHIRTQQDCASSLESTESIKGLPVEAALSTIHDDRWHEIVDAHLSVVEKKRHQHAIHLHLNYNTIALGIAFYHPYNGWWCFNSDLSRPEVHTAAKARVAALEQFLQDTLKDECLVLYKPNALELLAVDTNSNRNERGEWILSFSCMLRTQAARGPSTLGQLSKLFHTCLLAPGGGSCVLVEYKSAD